MKPMRVKAQGIARKRVSFTSELRSSEKKSKGIEAPIKATTPAGESVVKKAKDRLSNPPAIYSSPKISRRLLMCPPSSCALVAAGEALMSMLGEV